MRTETFNWKQWDRGGGDGGAQTETEKPANITEHRADKEQINQNRSAKLLHKPCGALSSSSKPQRKHAVSKQDRMREWKIP